ncbi:hypothetical protein [Zongyangia hominis]|uniref:Alcohol acetyltransferase n=1 Tax=Zongyangia hominis TaxID=2763677 RepID=A0A926ICA8_9FIRM|nr:hypothetical protein [Zongyangia hominis]MBC8571158.1 hypothetical protein [Zongyangia hominis]
MKQRKSNTWSRLDNAAKIFPSTTTKRDTKVFRFACELYELVDPIVLQQALDETMTHFPLYQSMMTRGLFWYYLEPCSQKPLVKLEAKPPLGPLYDANRKGLLFEVTYYRNRISLEVFHALSDGTGAMEFLRVLVYHYLIHKHGDTLGAAVPAMDYDASASQQSADSFAKYYNREGRQERHRTQWAHQLRGPRLSENRLRIIEGVAPVKDVLRKAHENHATLTVFLGAVLLCAIGEEMAVRDKKRPAVLTVPVNLRKYFDSQSARNFFSVINVGYDFRSGSGEFADVVEHLERGFAQMLTHEKLSERINMLAAIEHNFLVRLVPLALKDVVLRIADDFAAKEITASLSNIGRVTMPRELTPYIRLFDVFASTDILQICVCSFEENLTMSFSSAFVSTDVQRRFFRTLTGMGIPVTIAANEVDPDDSGEVKG